MDPVDFDDPDDPLDRELRALPGPRAPHTLLPRVLAAAAVGARADATGWFTWPLGWRLVSIAALAAFVVGLSTLFTSPPEGVSDAARTAGDVATVVRVVWEVMAQPVATYLFVLGVSLALACALAWAALEAALGGASHR
ncbi:MAG TPA: hypothetical protein VJ813_02940 [Vicinamibacterales bacterium]|nr:hypothetical protein [Vicinamibacterales bacterium]